ncbi:polysaccharide deacetylase family protein [Thalassotalea sp. Y01]|uniref:polysaccharide deacetylase family protein n=1 Tax=Thalassotalea sp. Y01 TaxID=2729613 RepID=UPI00145F9E62|nr:polysaccharide deacetylase family protein [Thalassotalea sp. Y01]NMP16094.1 polysaccharide deacetylase family protein [Thalassotalea sp. Y01]
MKKLVILLSVILMCCSLPSFATVILVYHHVSEKTPKSTSITPQQFEKHLQYLQQNDYKVVALNEVVERIKNNQPLIDKTVVITFDDGYSDILENGHPLLKRYGYPYTMFINPATVPNKAGMYLTWLQIKAMSDDGVLIGNHGYLHDSLVKVPKGVSENTWLDNKLAELVKSEKVIEQHTGQSWRYFALPYGEYTPQAQQKLEKLGFVVFTQQSGAVGASTDLTAVPRFPASMPYDKLAALKDKLNALAFDLTTSSQRAETIVPFAAQPDTLVTLNSTDFYANMLACFIAGKGKAQIQWQDKKSFTMVFDSNFNPGRNRANCTAPSISKPGRFYWYSRAWFVPKKDGSWYNN